MNQKLKKIRETLKYNQEEFSAIMEINQSTLSSYEKSNEKAIKITAKSLKNLREKLNINLEYLFTGKGKMFVNDIEIKDSESKYENLNNLNEDNDLTKLVIEDFKLLDKKDQKTIYLAILSKLKEKGEI